MKTVETIQKRIAELKLELSEYQLELEKLKSTKSDMKRELSNRKNSFYDYTSCMNCMDSLVREIEFCYDKLIKIQNSISDLEWVLHDDGSEEREELK